LNALLAKDIKLALMDVPAVYALTKTVTPAKLGSVDGEKVAPTTGMASIEPPKLKNSVTCNL
tara:strand:+ start:294 stop:479 length:186 start_codon:yes stop_codon:yes gene_type:complete